MNFKIKQSVDYNGKTIALPFLIDKNLLTTKEVDASNHFSGESTTLPQFAKAVRDQVLLAELQQDYKTVRKGLDWFIKHFTKEYMVLLD